MSWSFQVARVAGIPVRLHLTFLLLMGWLVSRGFQRGDQTLALLALGLFLCVLLHELGHSLVAQRFGVKVLGITLLPIGGVARMEQIPREPKQELWIALAGPLVNLALWPLFELAGRWFEGASPHGLEVLAARGFLFGKLAVLNLNIALFNLLPAFPLDGGRVLRAVLATRLPYDRATSIAAGIGQLAAFGLAYMGLTANPTNPMLVLVALFIFAGASEERVRVRRQTFVEGVPVREAMMTAFETLSRGDNLGRAADLMIAGTQHDFPVLQGAEVVGVLSRRGLLEGLSRQGRDCYVSEVMEEAPAAVAPDDPLEPVLGQVLGGGLTMVPVQTGGELCGLLTAENISEFLMVRAATYQGK